MANEGWMKKTVTLKDVDEMLRFQDVMLRKIKGQISDNEFGQILNNLSLGTGVASFFFPLAAIPLGITSLATAFISALTSSERSLLSSVVSVGTSALIDLQYQMRYELTSFDMAEIEFAYLDYTSKGTTVRFIQSSIRITGLRNKDTKRWYYES